MRNLEESGFVVEDSCVFSFPPGGKIVLLEGTIECLDNIILDVQKEIRVVSGRGRRALVKTFSFSYNARLRGVYNILRYCSADDHRPHPHKHIFDPFDGGRETNRFDIRDAEDIPTLGEVIFELNDWHTENIGAIAQLGLA
jgi:hypothetical protein